MCLGIERSRNVKCSSLAAEVIHQLDWVFLGGQLVGRRGASATKWAEAAV
jgi:hypothetical protein